MTSHQQDRDDKEDVHVARHENVLTEDGKVPVLDYSGAHKKVEPAEIRLVKKLDRWIMPMMWSMYWLNYLDRDAIALARLDNLDEELGITDSQYATCVSILFVGYILAQVPSRKLTCCFFAKSEPGRDEADGNVLATAFAGLIALGIFKLGGVAGIPGWRWLFIIQGIVTFVVAIIGIFLLLDDPTRTWWLPPRSACWPKNVWTATPSISRVVQARGMA